MRGPYARRYTSEIVRERDWPPMVRCVCGAVFQVATCWTLVTCPACLATVELSGDE